MTEQPKRKGSPKWLIALALAALSALGVLRPDLLPIADVVAEVAIPDLWQDDPLPVVE